MMKKNNTTVLLLGFLALFIIIAVGFLHRGTKTYKHAAATPIEVTKTVAKKAAFFLKIPGLVEASRAVVVQPQISGMVKQIAFIPGQYVSAGQLLFAIDPASYQAGLDKAKANLAKDKAQLTATKKDVARYQVLLQKGYISKQQYDQLTAQLEAETNTIKLDQAAIQQAQIDLGYTKILAPIAGKTGNVIIREGDIVTSSSNQILVTINQLEPIFVSFYLPQNYLAELLQYQQKQSLQVKVFSEDQKQLLDTGKVTFIDNSVNSNTGTIMLKATIANKNKTLYPGESVRVKLIFNIEKNLLAIPSQAVQNSQQGQFVYKVKNNLVLVTPVEILRQVGPWTYIKKGLKEGDLVATVFPPNLHDKALITVTS